MGNILFTNVRVLDGTGEHPYLGEVLVQGNRIKHVGRGSRTVPANGHTVIDGAGATLMPGMTEAHTHFSWNNAGSLDAIFRMPPEEHTLLAATNAKIYLDGSKAPDKEFKDFKNHVLHTRDGYWELDHIGQVPDLVARLDDAAA